MKKLISILLTFVMVLSCMGFTVSASYDPVVHAEEFATYDAADFDPFAGKDTVVVSIIGGSLTCGDGTNYQQYWGKTLVEKYLPAKFPGHKFVFKNAGVGGHGSDQTVMRFGMDVGPNAPDLVILEHCVNDAWRDNYSSIPSVNRPYLDLGKRNVESEIQQALAFDKVPYMMVVGLTCSENTAGLVKEYKDVADHYNIPTVDCNAYTYDVLMAPGGELDFCALCRYKSKEDKLACPAHDIHHLITSCKQCLGRLNAYVQECSGNSAMTWQEHIPVCTGTCVANTLADSKSSCTQSQQSLSHKHNLFWNWATGDGVHCTSEASLKAFLQPIVNYIEENGQAAFRKPNASVDPIFTETTTPKGMTKLKTLKLQDTALSANWSEGSAYTDTNGNSVPNYTTSVVGAKHTFKFHGNSLAFFGPRNTDLGQFKVTIDEGTANEVTSTQTQYYVQSLGYGNKTTYNISMAGLTDEWHTATIENIDASSTATSSNTTMLAYYAVNTDTPKPFADYVVINETAAEIKDGIVFVPHGTKNASVNLYGPYDNAADATASVSIDGVDVPATITYNALNNAYDIALTGSMDVNGGNYLFNVTGLKFNGKATDDINVTFTTKSGVYFDSLKFTDADGDKVDSLNDKDVTFSMMGYNDNIDDEIVFLSLVQKDSRGLIKSIAVSETLIPASGGSAPITDTLTLKNAVSTDNIEIFAWKKGVLKPYTEKIVFSLSTFGFTSLGNNVGLFFDDPIVLNNAVSGVVCKKVGDSIVVTGSSTKSIVTLKIENSDGEFLWLDQKNVDDYGNFEFECKMRAFSVDGTIITIQSDDL